MTTSNRRNYHEDADRYNNIRSEEEHNAFMSERCRDKGYDFNRLWDYVGLDNDK